jgi:FkbM family methyltransferase
MRKNTIVGFFVFSPKRLSVFTWAIDLGANIGVYTTFIARHCSRVDAFEPDKHLVSKLEHNLQLNGIGNVAIHAMCVSDVTGRVNFQTACARNFGLGKIAERGIEQRSISLRDLLTGSERQSLFIKMEIEGAELLAVKGAQEAFEVLGLSSFDSHRGSS